MKVSHCALLLTLMSSLLAPLVAAANDDAQCVKRGEWRVPGQSDVVSVSSLFSKAASSSAVLLGELHTSAEHHRWQLHSLAALHSHNPKLVIGFEMFPRSVQGTLDRYISGELSDQQLLEAVEWPVIWNFPPEYYLPLFQFARMHQLPMIALNVQRSLVSDVARTGWAQIPAEQREGVTDPAEASTAYIESLRQVFASHQQPASQAEDSTRASEGDEPDDKQVEAFERFVEAQLTWDRAMAQAISEALQARPDGYTVVGVIGRGHLEYGHGVPHQLNDLGIDDNMVLLPFDESEPCSPPAMNLAYAVFGVTPQPDPPVAAKPRLGVLIRDADEAGVLVDKVVDDSVAAEAGLKPLDVILQAAGVPTDNTAQLIEIIGRQAPGTWLPLSVKRGTETMDIVARFPIAF